jgi:hypothetical protein
MHIGRERERHRASCTNNIYLRNTFFQRQRQKKKYVYPESEFQKQNSAQKVAESFLLLLAP